MVDSIALGADGQANHTLSLLRASDAQGPLSADTKLVPGLWLNADPALGLGGSFSSPAGRLLEISATTANPGNWIGLHATLPVDDLSGVGVIGFAARIAAPDTHIVRACIRSGTENGFEDCFFDKHLLFRPEEASHLDAIAVGRRLDLPDRAPWRELILFLPTQSFDLSLIDLRVFVV